MGGSCHRRDWRPDAPRGGSTLVDEARVGPTPHRAAGQLPPIAPFQLRVSRARPQPPCHAPLRAAPRIRWRRLNYWAILVYVACSRANPAQTTCQASPGSSPGRPQGTAGAVDPRDGGNPATRVRTALGLRSGESSSGPPALASANAASLPLSGPIVPGRPPAQPPHVRDERDLPLERARVGLD